MNVDKIVFGVILIILGILFLFANLNLLSWDFVTGLWKLWPLVLVLWGLDLVIKGNKVLKTILFLFIVLISFVIYFYSQKDTYLQTSTGKDHALSPYNRSTDIYNC